MSRNVADPDLWGHVTYGREVLRDGHLHESTTWSYSVDDFRWINHENIAELMMATADSFGGQAALLLVKSVLTVFLLGLPLFVARKNGAGLLTCLAIVVLLSSNISFHWLIRPHMLSYTCGTILFFLLAMFLPGAVAARSSDRSFSRWLWLIPVLMCFWTNSHGGYLAGLAILAAWLGLDAAELLFRKDSRFAPTVRHHAALFLVSAAACLINPYGLELHQWILSSLGRPRPEISEWAPLPLLTMDGLPFWSLVLTTVICLRKSGKPVRWPAMIVLLLLTWQAVMHQRHLPFVAMLAAFILPPHIESCVRQASLWFTKRAHQSGRAAPATSGRNAILPATVLLVVLTCLQYPRQATLHVDRGFYPVSAMKFMTDHRLRGRVFVTFNWAQYALAVFSHTRPESRIAIDGRFRTCYPQNVIDMYFDFILGDAAENSRYREDASGAFNPFKALEYRTPNLVLFERRRSHCVQTMQESSDDWCLLYQDSLAQLWGRRSIYDDPASPDFLPPAFRSITNDIQDNSVPWPAIPAPSAAARRNVSAGVIEDGRVSAAGAGKRSSTHAG